MRHWHSFTLRPERQKGVSAIHQLHDLHADISDWVASNKSKTIKVMLSESDRYGTPSWPFGTIRVKLRSARDATLFKLFFADHIIPVSVLMPTSRGPFDPVILPLIRRAMPSIIAYDICGVQPMTGPTAAIYSMRVRYKAATKRAAKHAAQRRAVRKAKQTAERAASKTAIMQQLLENTLKELRDTVA